MSDGVRFMLLFYRNKTLSRLSLLNVIGFRNKRRIISAYLGLFTKPMLNTILRLSNSGCKIYQILTLRFKSSSACTSQIRLFTIPTGLSAVADQTRIFPKKSKYKFCLLCCICTKNVDALKKLSNSVNSQKGHRYHISL